MAGKRTAQLLVERIAGSPRASSATVLTSASGLLCEERDENDPSRKSTDRAAALPISSFLLSDCPQLSPIAARTCRVRSVVGPSVTRFVFDTDCSETHGESRSRSRQCATDPRPTFALLSILPIRNLYHCHTMAAWGFQTDSKPATTEQPTATSWGSAAPAAPSQPAQPTQNGTNGSISGWGAATNGDSNHAAGPSSWGGAAPSAPANGASASTGGWGNGESAAPAAQPSNGWPAQAEGTGSWGAPDANGVPNGSEAPPAEPEDDKDRQQRGT